MRLTCPLCGARDLREFTYRGSATLMALRQVLELGLAATVLPNQVALSHVGQAFDEAGNLKDEMVAKLLRNSLTRLIAHSEADPPALALRPWRAERRAFVLRLRNLAAGAPTRDAEEVFAEMNAILEERIRAAGT